ncbi:hypothetical protein NSA25_01005 [Erysipelatoclostridium ramosum]|uniref:flavodoxin n=1 Tax=Thomasclavelia ramosa TaxID=1547 RepID=UPI00192AD974|nr:flavodoxin [Thomasclavelia ramosa]MCR1946423.1 hypothetical protein [Thomasclavelia ramosa]QQY26343.1 hypothetical protein I6I63_09675 [Thomasclavelia ramosa]
MKNKILFCYILIILALVLNGCQGNSKQTKNSDSQIVSSDMQSYEENEILIAYFSRVGNTNFDSDVDTNTSASLQLTDEGIKGNAQLIGEEIQELTGGDLLLIHTASPYSQDYQETVDESHRENNENILPKLDMSIDNLDQYKMIYLVYPTWSSDLPKAVSSFLTEYSLTGKQIIPICTHGGYGWGNSLETIQTLCKDATVLEGIDIPDDEISNIKQLLSDFLNGN